MINLSTVTNHTHDNIELNAQKYANFNSSKLKWEKNNSREEPISSDQGYFEINKIFQVILNISGFKYEILLKNLNQLPSSRLGKIFLAKSIENINDLCDLFKPKENELYFDRDPKIFNNILNYYRSGKLHVLDNICPIAFRDELEYWGIDEIYVDNCCSLKFYLKKEDILDEIDKINANKNNEIIKEKKASIVKKRRLNIKQKVWNIVDKPETSNAAKVFSIISMFVVIFSMLIMILLSIPDFKVNSNLDAQNNLTNLIAQNNTVTDENELEDNPYLELAELICVIWFLFEYLIRLWASPSKKKFFLNFLNAIDLLSILPYFLSLAPITITQNFNLARRFIALIRVLRIVRLLKLARHSTGLQLLGLTLLKSYRELGMLLFFVVFSVIVFSSLLFFAESDVPNTQFISIPASFWWAIITISTVGYGDMVPGTFTGKTLTAVCCVCGIIVMALPVSIIANNFTLFYSEQRKRELLFKFQKDINISSKSIPDEVNTQEPQEDTRLKL